MHVAERSTGDHAYVMVDRNELFNAVDVITSKPLTLDEETLIQTTGPILAQPTRKEQPVYSGLLKYFPDAVKAVAHASLSGNEQHNPGSSLHWDRSKSGDELDALSRHLIEAGTVDKDGIRHSAKVAWRALANLQKEIEAEQGQ